MPTTSPSETGGIQQNKDNTENNENKAINEKPTQQPPKASELPKGEIPKDAAQEKQGQGEQKGLEEDVKITSEIDENRLSSFKKGDTVYRNLNGEYEEYEIVETKRDIWKLKKANSGNIQDWNAANNGGFILKDPSRDEEVKEEVKELTPLEKQINALKEERASLLREKEGRLNQANKRNGLFGDVKADPNDLFGGQGFDASEALRLEEKANERISAINRQIEDLSTKVEDVKATAEKENAGQQEIVIPEEDKDVPLKPNKYSKSDITLSGISRDELPEKEWESVLRMANTAKSGEFILKDENGKDTETTYTWKVNKRKPLSEVLDAGKKAVEDGKLENNSNFVKNQGDGIPQSVSQGEYGALSEADSRVGQISEIIRRGLQASFRDAQEAKGAGSQKELEEREAERFAKQNDLWIPFNKIVDFGRPFPSGNENEVYYNQSENAVYKVNNLTNAKGISSLLDQVVIHNRLFPNAKYELIGFTGFDGRSIYPVIKQKHIDSSEFATPEEISSYMESLGFEKINNTSFSNGELYVSDLFPRNVLKDTNGDIYVIDNIISKVSGSELGKKEEVNPTEEPKAEQQDPNWEYGGEKQEKAYGKDNKIVTESRYEELKKRMRDKLNNLNSGFDPEVLAIGLEMAAFHMEAGARKFSDFTKKMVGDLGESIKPYLKPIYNGVRDLPTMEEYEPMMDEYGSVKSTDIEAILKENTSKPVEQKEQKDINFDKNAQPNERVLQRNNKRVSKPTSSGLFDGAGEGQRARGSSGPQGGKISETDGAQQQPTGRERDLLSRDADLLEPALVDFNAEENDIASFNPTQKYNDNIKAIETVISLINEKRKATPQEKEILSKYVGFGGLKDILLNPDAAEGWGQSNSKFKTQVKRIIELTDAYDNAVGTKGSLSSIKGSILNAHFTSSSVIRSVYDGINKLGFTGGRILEPSSGIGNFITFMPNIIKGSSNITAVELDDLTGHVLKHLHDDVNVKVSGIQDANIPNNSQDLVISNVPFGNYKIFDKSFKGEKAQFQNRIHNYFFAKAVDMAREGGIIAFVTSKGVLDAPGNESLRSYLNENTEFLGAVRLPNNAFKNNANTEVVTDIIFLKKNTTGVKNNTDFVSVKEVEAIHRDGEKQTVTVNNYFIENPQNMLGNIVAGGLYSRDDYTIENKGSYDLSQAIMQALPSGVYSKATSGMGLQANDSQQTIDAIKEGNIEFTGDRLVRKEDGQLSEIKINEPTPKIQHYIKLRNSLMNLIYSEYLGKKDNELDAIRKELNQQYDSFTEKYGKLSVSATKIAKQDADGYNVQSLEVSGKQDGKADIFRQRTIQPIHNKLTAENIDEAIVVSLYENASIDIERIAELMNISIPEVLEISKGKIFEEPTGGFVTRDEYLSGNVKLKLKQAQQAVTDGNSDFQNNVDELLNVIPKDIPAMSIEARLGSRWIPQEVYTDFAKHIFNSEYTKITYQKTIDSYAHSGRLGTVEATTKYGTSRVNGADILIDALMINPPKVYDTVREYGQEKRVINTEETAKAIEKYEEVRTVFEDWVYKSEDRRKLLSGIYNEKFNTSVQRTYDGDHLNISGINGVTLRKHQKDAIWMLLQNNGGIIDHLVGAGKTYVMVAGTMEMKRTGISKKPMIIALKSTIPQIVESYRNAFPMAKVLAPLEKDFTKENRNKLFAQIANNEWDVIIMSHENYGKIPHEREMQEKFIQDEMDEVEAERAELEAAGEKHALKGLEIRLKNLEAKLEKLSDIDKDNSLTFEQMGIDHIMVDESQQFKNLSYVTKQRGVAGLSKAEGSKRAFNLFIGIRYLQQKYGADKGTTFLSGTPISNSMVEMYLLLKYLRPNKMKELEFNSFDSWATTFASPNTDIEFTVAGSFKQKTRFREFINVPELSMLYREIADIRTDANTPLDKPNMKGGGYSVVPIKMSDDQVDYGKRLMEVAKTKSGEHIGMLFTKNQEKAVMLLVTNLSSKMAIDMRLINPNYAYDPNGKIARLVDNVYDTFNNTNEHKGTQLIFSDLGTPKNKSNKTSLLRDYMEDELQTNLDTLNEIFGDPDVVGYKYPSMKIIEERLRTVLELTDAEISHILEEADNSVGSFNVYAEVKYRLIEKGIPEDQVVFIHDYNSQKAKEKLFDDINNGNIRIILGSTQKLGTGVNVQERIAAIHHLDVPWTPAAMEQRNGRGLRQGNWLAKNHLNNELPAYAYATELTLDAYKYQLLDTKQRFLDQVKSGSTEERVAREADGDSESGVGYAELVAMMSGNKDFLLKDKLEQKINKLKRSKRNFLSEVYEAKEKVQEIEQRIPDIESKIKLTKQNATEITEAMQKDEHGKMIVSDIDGKKITGLKDEKGKDRDTERIDYAKKAVDIVHSKLSPLVAAKYANYDLFSIGGVEITGFWGTDTNYTTKQEEIKTSLFIKAKNGEKYSLNLSDIPGIFLNNIQKAIEGIPAILEQQEKVLERGKNNLNAYDKLLQKGEKWEKEPELQQAIDELKEVNKRLDTTEKPEEKKEEEQEEQEVEIESPDQKRTRELSEYLSNNEIKPVTDRTVPLMERLEDGKSVVEIKREQEKQPASDNSEGKLLPVEEFRHTKTGQILYNVKINGRSDGYEHMVSVAKRNNPYTKQHPWNKFSKGFLFENREDAVKFKNAIDGDEAGKPRFSGLGDFFKSKETKSIEKALPIVDAINNSSNFDDEIVFMDEKQLAKDLIQQGHPRDSVNEIKDVSWRGVTLGGKIYIHPKISGNKLSVAAVISHEKIHAYSSDRFKKNYKREAFFAPYYKIIGQNEVAKLLVARYLTDSEGQQVEEYIAHLVEKLVNEIPLNPGAQAEELLNNLLSNIKDESTKTFIFDYINEILNLKNLQDVINTQVIGTANDSGQQSIPGSEGLYAESNQGATAKSGAVPPTPGADIEGAGRDGQVNYSTQNVIHTNIPEESNYQGKQPDTGAKRFAIDKNRDRLDGRKGRTGQSGDNGVGRESSKSPSKGQKGEYLLGGTARFAVDSKTQDLTDYLNTASERYKESREAKRTFADIKGGIFFTSLNFSLFNRWTCVIFTRHLHLS